MSATNYATANYVGDGLTSTYAIPFSYQRAGDVQVTVNGVAASFTLPSPNAVQLSTVPASGAAVRVFRSTSQNSRRVDYTSSATITEEDLDTDSVQSFYMAQEALDVATRADVIADNLDNSVALAQAAAAAAQTSEVNAGAAATAAAGSASAADYSSTIAGLSANQAGSYLHQFQAVYLWSSPSDPAQAVWPVGGALQKGSLYFNTTLNEMRVWNGTAWVLPTTVVGVSSFNTRTGAVTLTSGDVTGALGYSPLAPADATTAATANKLVQRDAFGYAYVVHLSHSSADGENPTVSQFMVTNGSDNFLRKASVAHVQTALGLSAYAPLASPTFTGTPAAPTAAADTNTTQVATTAFVLGQAYGTTPAMNGTGAAGSSVKWARGDHVHPTDTSRAPTASPTFTGTVTAAAVNATGSVDLQADVKAKSYRERAEVAVSPVAGVVTIDCAAGNTFVVTVNAAITSWTFNNIPTSGIVYDCVLILVSDGTARSVNNPAAWSWGDGSPITTSHATSGKENHILLRTRNAGSKWIAANGGVGY